MYPQLQPLGNDSGSVAVESHVTRFNVLWLVWYLTLAW